MLTLAFVVVWKRLCASVVVNCVCAMAEKTVNVAANRVVSSFIG